MFEPTRMEQLRSDFESVPPKEGICIGTWEGYPPCHSQCFECFLKTKAANSQERGDHE